MHGVSWTAAAFALIAPTALGLLVAWPFWWRRQEVIGNAVGAGVLFAVIIFLIGADFVTQQRENARCAAGLVHCVSRVNAHMPFLLYAFFGIVDACALFWISLIVEERRAPKSWLPAAPDSGGD
jgi:hypothetical protein